MSASQFDLIMNQVKLMSPDDLIRLIKRAAEFLEQKQKLSTATPETNDIDLQALGIDPTQAAELRASFATFEDWNNSDMDIYNNYDATKHLLDANV